MCPSRPKWPRSRKRRGTRSKCSVALADIVITSAPIPGRAAPTLISETNLCALATADASALYARDVLVFLKCCFAHLIVDGIGIDPHSDPKSVAIASGLGLTGLTTYPA